MTGIRSNKVQGLSDIAFSVRHHAPCDHGNLFRPQTGSGGQEHHDPITVGIAPPSNRGQGGFDLPFGENLCLLAQPRHETALLYENIAMRRC
jgi:hypothetical protein